MSLTMAFNLGSWEMGLCGRNFLITVKSWVANTFSFISGTLLLFKADPEALNIGTINDPYRKTETRVVKIIGKKM